MSTAQINARIDSDLKKAGDDAFRQIGCSPTQVIRAVWSFAGSRRHDLAAIRGLLEDLEGKRASGELELEAQARMSRVLSGACIFENALSEMGAEKGSEQQLLSYDELLEMACFEKAQERGLA